MSPKLVSIPLVITLLMNSSAFGQAIDVNTMRVVGSMCGGGLSLQVRGEFDARLIRLLGPQVSGDGGGSVDVGQVKDLIEAIPEGDRGDAFQTYTACIAQVVNALMGTAAKQGETSADLIIDDLIVPDPLSIVKNGQQFGVLMGDSRAIESRTMIISFNEMRENFVYYSYTDAETGKNVHNKYVYQGQSIELPNGCNVILYAIDHSNGQASFLINCA